MKVTSENYEQSYRAQINEKVLSTRLFKLCGSDLMRPRYRYRHSPGHFLTLLGVVGHFSHIVRSQVRVEFRMLLRVGGKSRFSYCWKLRPGVESHFSHVGHHTESKLMRNHLSGGKSFFTRNNEKITQAQNYERNLHPTQKI